MPYRPSIKPIRVIITIIVMLLVGIAHNEKAVMAVIPKMMNSIGNLYRVRMCLRAIVPRIPITIPSIRK